MSRPLENKLALVTGSSRGIGAAVAARLAREGAAVIVTYASSAERAEAVVVDIRREGGEAEAVGADLGSPDGVKTLIASIDGAFGGRFGGRLDILVNNAGTVGYGPFLDQPDDAYDKHFNVNVRAPIALAKETGRRMAKAGWGRIVNIGSAFGEAAPMGGVTLYVATKFALHGFTRGLSRELGPFGVTVNGVQPGPIDTDLSPNEGTDEHAAMVKLTSVGRFGKVEEIAAAVAYLASPEASFTNGENLTVDGGWNA
ncbi:SDR family oxidoreductase [Phenylobacterium sp.]|uniref:SDR family NAD(P)-dependent oxidoreductase n=1 Tax=Phenylobacterium sp. TaxID=1871053 RepID=UPI001215E8AC|nr:SDR family oxidoreductase [Phenylobacterium sp.]THD64394.1 MAG: SDR family oxidoreductase [Phenylobacterium sp.]